MATTASWPIAAATAAASSGQPGRKVSLFVLANITLPLSRAGTEPATPGEGESKKGEVATLSLIGSLETWAAPPGTARPRLSLCVRANRHGLDADELAAELAVAKRDGAGGQREQGMILADADSGARTIFGAALAHDDVAADDALAAELLHAEALRLGIAAVTRRAACFLMCHGSSLALNLFTRPY